MQNWKKPSVVGMPGTQTHVHLALEIKGFHDSSRKSVSEATAGSVAPNETGPFRSGSKGVPGQAVFWPLPFDLDAQFHLELLL